MKFFNPLIFHAENIPEGATGAARTLRWLLNSRSFHQAILNLVEPSAPVLIGEVVVRKPFLLGLLSICRSRVAWFVESCPTNTHQRVSSLIIQKRRS